MKQTLINILSPLLYYILTRVLKQLKPFFLAEDDTLRQQLISKGFHPALCAHSSILFGYRSNDTCKPVRCISMKVECLSRAIHIHLLASDKGHAIMQQLGIPHCFGNGLEFWFLEGHTPYVPYTIPTKEVTPKRIAIYTALTGDYDDVHEILYKEEGVDYLLFTNNKKLKSSTWQVVYVESELDNVLLSREIKMLPHKYLGDKYEASIYIDANVVIYGELSQLTNYLNNDVSFAVTKHSERKRVKDEIDIIQKRKSINREDALAQYERYVTEGFMDDMGLAECGILVRKHNKVMLQQVMEAWWKGFQNGIRRDQISLLPVIQRLNFKAWRYMDGSIWHNQFCKIIAHKK